MANENTSVEICVLNLGETERNVLVRLSFESLTASGKY